jgi:hypothetical protein
MALFEFTFSDQTDPVEPLVADYAGWDEAKRVAAQTLGVMASHSTWENGSYSIGVDIRRDSEAEVVNLTLSIVSEKRLEPKEGGA